MAKKRRRRLNKKHCAITAAGLIAVIMGISSVVSYATYDPLVDEVKVNINTKELHAKHFIQDEKKESVDEVKLVSAPTSSQMKKLGTYPVTVSVDGREFDTTLKVVDKVKPTITHTQNLTVGKGTAVSYKTGVKVNDNVDGTEGTTLTVDNSKVDLNKLGKYPLTYIATDKSGNKATKTVTVTVTDPDKAPASMTEVYKEAKKVLDQITKPGMTKREIVQKIYYWEMYNVTFVNWSDKRHWENAAMKTFKYRRGDCYNFYAAARALFDVAGIENMKLTEVDNPNHSWNFVKVEEGWYHFYGHPTKGVNLCLKTDDFMKNYSQASDEPNQFVWREKNKPASGK